MGFYDRDYQRGGYYDDRQPGFHLGGPTTLTTKLVIGFFGVYLLQLFTQPREPISPSDYGWFTNTFSLSADWWQRPWTVYQLLTYGFLHDPTDLKHIVFNMLGFGSSAARWRPVTGRANF